MKKICVTSVVSLLIAFVLVFAGCEQPVSAGLKDDGSVTVEGNAVTGEDNTSGEVTSGEGSTTVVEGETGDGTTETGSGVVSVEVDTGDDDVVVSVVVVEPDDPSVESVEVDPALELSIVDLDGREGPFTVDYEDNPRITLKAVVKGGDGTTITDAVWKTDGTTAYSLQDNGDGTCTLTARTGGFLYGDYDDTFTLSVSSGNDSGSCTIHYHADTLATDGFID